MIVLAGGGVIGVDIYLRYGGYRELPFAICSRRHRHRILRESQLR
jgi:hypothetical protein